MPRRTTPQKTSTGTHPGYFLVVEGLDASGKTTLARRLVTAYEHAGLRVTAVREPGGTRVSEQVRRILLDTRSSLSARAELFLYLAARAELVEQVIIPALTRGELVIADRFSLSTLAYQVGGRHLPARAVAAADRLARKGLAPDFTVILTVTEAAAALRRSRSDKIPDRIESEPAGFFRDVRAEYRRHCGKHRGQLVIDSRAGADTVFDLAKRQIDLRLKRWGIVGNRC
jgi:dTMP kinase